MYAEIMNHLHSDSTYHKKWPYDQYYISYNIVLNRSHFDIYNTDILNTPIGRALRHNWWKNKEMYQDMNCLLNNDITLTDEPFICSQYYDDTPIIEEYEYLKEKRQRIIDYIRNIVINSQSILEGNSFYHHHTLDICPDLFYKQMNLFWLGKKAEKRICEIGFNAGHSTMLLLLGRDQTPLEFTVFDIGHHDYTKPCISFIQSEFSHVCFEYIEGDSTITMSQWIQVHDDLLGSYDLVHIDGGHTEHCIMNDMQNSDLLVKKGGYLIIDDTNMLHINQYVDNYISSGKYIEVKYCDTKWYPHRILKKV
jgi:hypothetical protein